MLCHNGAWEPPVGSILKNARKLLFLAFYILLIYSSIPFVWRVEVYLRARHMLMFTVWMALAIYIAVLVLVMIRYAERRWLAAVALAVFTVVYALIIIEVRGFDKKIHFIEYGILTFLFYDVFRDRMRKIAAYAAALASVVAVGWVDELFQSMVPHRNYDIGDFTINVYAALLMLLLVFIFERFRALKDEGA